MFRGVNRRRGDLSRGMGRRWRGRRPAARPTTTRKADGALGLCRRTGPPGADGDRGPDVLRRRAVQGRDRPGPRHQPVQGRPPSRAGQGQRPGACRDRPSGKHRHRAVETAPRAPRAAYRYRRRHCGAGPGCATEGPGPGGGWAARRDRHPGRRPRTRLGQVGGQHGRGTRLDAPRPRRPADGVSRPGRRGGDVDRARPGGSQDHRGAGDVLLRPLSPPRHRDGHDPAPTARCRTRHPCLSVRDQSGRGSRCVGRQPEHHPRRHVSPGARGPRPGRSRGRPVRHLPRRGRRCRRARADRPDDLHGRRAARRCGRRHGSPLRRRKGESRPGGSPKRPPDDARHPHRPGQHARRHPSCPPRRR